MTIFITITPWKTISFNILKDKIPSDSLLFYYGVESESYGAFSYVSITPTEMTVGYVDEKGDVTT